MSQFEEIQELRKKSYDNALGWINSNLCISEDSATYLPKNHVYEAYSSSSTNLQQVLLKRAEFGKLLKSVFPDIKTSRKGSRGQSQYCYNSLSWNDGTSSPVVSVQSAENQSDCFSNLSQIFQFFKHRDPSKARSLDTYRHGFLGGSVVP